MYFVDQSVTNLFEFSDCVQKPVTHESAKSTCESSVQLEKFSDYEAPEFMGPEMGQDWNSGLVQFDGNVYDLDKFDCVGFFLKEILAISDDGRKFLNLEKLMFEIGKIPDLCISSEAYDAIKDKLRGFDIRIQK